MRSSLARPCAGFAVSPLASSITRPSSSWNMGGVLLRPSIALALQANGSSTKGYSSPLDLCTVMTLIRSESLSRRRISSSLWPSTCSARWRIRACSPSSSAALRCNHSARCSRLVRRRSPCSSNNRRAGTLNVAKSFRSMGSTPCCCHNTRKSLKRSTCCSQNVSSWFNCSSACHARPTLRVAMAARTSRSFAG
ncbi:hypothetical protein D3C76_1127670 [compost metagenome]